MTSREYLLFMLAAILGAGGCRPDRVPAQASSDSTALAERETRLSSRLAGADTGSEAPLAQWVLPPALAEISGVGLTADQRLLAHNDEVGRIFEVDYRRGVVVKSFWVGAQVVRDDFEAITVSGRRIFLLASSGRIYEFEEGEDGSRVTHKLIDTGLGGDCEFEGLAFDSTSNALVLACKNILVKGLTDVVLLYKYSLAEGDKSRPVQLRIPSEQAVGGNGWKRFTPSDLAVDPISGDYVLVSSQEKGVLRITSAGAVVWSRRLPFGHEMSEGVAVTRDGLLIVSDESISKDIPGAITLYRWR